MSVKEYQSIIILASYALTPQKLQDKTDRLAIIIKQLGGIALDIKTECFGVFHRILVKFEMDEYTYKTSGFESLVQRGDIEIQDVITRRQTLAEQLLKKLFRHR